VQEKGQAIVMPLSEKQSNIPPGSARERFHRVMKFQNVDRIPNCELGPWPETQDEWYKQGMAHRVPVADCWGGQPFFGLDPLYCHINVIDKGPVPPFKEETLEETDRYIISRGSNGIVTKALKAQRSMHQFLEFPVKNKDDFEMLKERLDTDELSRYPALPLIDSRTRRVPLACPGSMGLYMQLRRWLGTENLSMAYYDQPDLIHEMLDFIVDFILRIEEKVGGSVQADAFVFGEDIAFKNGPLISPNMFAEFFAPRYKRITDALKAKGVDIFVLESDGNFEILMPQLIECGITAHIPVEAASGMDPVKLLKEYGDDLALIGGIDKRCLLAGKEEIKRELDTKLPFIVENRGCIPTIDGDLGTDISLENFLYYMELKSDYLGRS